jgi:hypothetical protein
MRDAPPRNAAPAARASQAAQVHAVEVQPLARVTSPCRATQAENGAAR